MTESEYNTAHAAAIQTYMENVRKAYQDAIKKVSKLPIGTLRVESWLQNKEVTASIVELVEALNSQVLGHIGYGIEVEWDRANDAHDFLANGVVNERIAELPESILATWYSKNIAARDAFMTRTRDGLTLSERVWKVTSRFQKEIETTITLGIYEGHSASTIASQLTQYLNNPDGLYRRVRKVLDIPDSPLVLSQAARSYSPGKGRYRSSYRNAFRLVRHEVNSAYELSHQQRRLQQDFIVGTRIRVSHGHNPALDRGGIRCIALQGDYPVTFDWSNKWHTQCLCNSTSILKTRQELDADLELIIAGGTPTRQSVNLVSTLPTNFSKYVTDNQSLWKNWQTKPKFLDNI